MTAHELAEQLLAGPNYPVVVDASLVDRVWLPKPNEVHKVKQINTDYYTSDETPELIIRKPVIQLSL